MHELALAHGVIEALESEARAQAFTRVNRVVLEVGAFSCVDPDALAMGFDAASRGTLAEGAALDVRTPPGRARCFECGTQMLLAKRGDPCPACGSQRVFVTGGEELTIKELEVT